MPRYIDADTLNEKMYHEAFEEDSDMQKWDDGCWIRYKMFENAIASVPTADVVEVVRCKDCKWYDMTDPCGTLTPNAHRCKRVTRLWMEEDGFCDKGERRE